MIPIRRGRKEASRTPVSVLAAYTPRHAPDDVAQQQFVDLAHHLNQGPGKCLGYKTLPKASCAFARWKLIPCPANGHDALGVDSSHPVRAPERLLVRHHSQADG